MKLALSTILLGAFVFSANAQEEPKTFTLQNGAELTLHPSATMPERCEIMGQAMPDDFSGICLEFPKSALSKEFEPLNWYSRELRKVGFKWASGAANQYWFNWPTEDGCFLRLNATALPKEQIKGDDWSGIETYVALFDFENEKRCE